MRRYFLLAEDVLRRKLLENLKEFKLLLIKHQEYDKFIDELESFEKNAKDEKYYQLLLEKLYATQLVERTCEHGETDIHLLDTVIEIKRWKNYKHALGQLLAYNDSLCKRMEVVFFGQYPTKDELNKIVNLFHKYNIKVHYFLDKDDQMITITSDHSTKTEEIYNI